MSYPKIDLSALGVDGIMFLISRIPRAKLVEDAKDLRKEIAAKQALSSMIDTYLEENPQVKEEDNSPAPADIVKKQGLPEQLPPAPPPISQGSNVNDAPNKRVRRNRGTLQERNTLLQQQNEKYDTWLYRTEYEPALFESGYISEDEGDIKEVVRGFLRQAESKNAIISKTAYSIASTNIVVTQLMYGLPTYIESENQETYRKKFEDKAHKLGFFVTQEEALKHRTIQSGQIELVAH